MRGRFTGLGPAAVAGVAVAVVTLGAMHKLGVAGLLVPLVLVVVPLALRHPAAVTGLTVGLVVVCEGPSFGLFTFTRHLYTAKHNVTAVDVLFILAILGAGLKVLERRRGLRFPPAELGVALGLILAAIAAGVIVGHANGASYKAMPDAWHILVYLVIVPMLVVNLDIDDARLRRVLVAIGVLAMVKAVLGLLQLASGHGTSLGYSNTALTYYEPTANWLTMIVLLCAIALLLRPPRRPVWLLLGSPVLLACLMLSYRRSFWIGLALAVVLLVVFGLSTTGRRMLLPTVAVVGVVIWLVGSIVLPADSPVVQRAQTLRPSALTTDAGDRYRLDERANVWAAIKHQPVTGLGLTIPWQATARPLGLDLGLRNYVHFAALYWWLKMGILGVIAYAATLLAAMRLSWRIWRRADDPVHRAIGLASAVGAVGLIPIEMTASFTGVDLRFTVLFGAHLGLLAVLARHVGEPRDDAAAHVESGHVA